ncbi:MAG: hypothetical protein ABIK09_10030 [Pseudomonadota bacterium]
MDGILAAAMRCISAKAPLVDVLEGVRDRLTLDESTMRWKRPVVRLLLLSCMNRRGYLEEKRRCLSRSTPLYRKVVDSVEDTGPLSRAPLRDLTSDFLDRKLQMAWQFRETKDETFHLAVHLLRDIYDESMSVILDSVTERVPELDDFFHVSDTRKKDRGRGVRGINPWAVVFAYHFFHQHQSEGPIQSPPFVPGLDLVHGEDPEEWETKLSEEERELLQYLRSHVEVRSSRENQPR